MRCKWWAWTDYWRLWSHGYTSTHTNVRLLVRRHTHAGCDGRTWECEGVWVRKGGRVGSPIKAAGRSKNGISQPIPLQWGANERLITLWLSNQTKKYGRCSRTCDRSMPSYGSRVQLRSATCAYQSAELERDMEGNQDGWGRGAELVSFIWRLSSGRRFESQ